MWGHAIIFVDVGLLGVIILVWATRYRDGFNWVCFMAVLGWLAKIIAQVAGCHA